MKYYNQSTHAVLHTLSTQRSGLTTDEAAKRLLEHGPNTLPEPKRIGVLGIFLHQFKNPLIYVLLAATVISLLLQEYTDALFIALVLLLNAGIGTYQENKAEKSAASLQKMVKLIAKVRRNGIIKTMDSVDLVPGDIVYLESGNKAPADIRLLEVNELSCDESFLTGESNAIEKMTAELDGERAIGDQKNMVFKGSTMLYGRGIGVVVSTGIHTEMGKIADSLASTDSFKAPLLIRMESFAKQVAYIIFALIGVLALITTLQGMPIQDIFFLSIALAVAAIPEGLPIAITVALSIATNWLAQKNVIVRKLAAVEGLGSCTIIASDKTGTLTLNNQTVKKVVLTDGTEFDISGEGYNGVGEWKLADHGAILTSAYEVQREAVARAGLLCNEAQLRLSGDEWEYSGDSVDIAFLALAMKAGLDLDTTRAEYSIVGELPFESERKFAATFYALDDGKVGIALKGAPETILARCVHADKAQKERLTTISKQLTSEGYRTMAVGQAVIQPRSKYDEDAVQEVQVLAIVGLKDPLRPEVIGSVEQCHSAGVQVAMVTGDHPLTALSIAKELGIAKDETDVITGIEFAEKLKVTNSLREAVKGKTVFARVSPLQKMEIVEGLGEMGHFVAVTGDGVNDVPALKKANIGIAMGTGTDLAKETADIIITDDNFHSIEQGIEGGRHAYDNIRKVTYLLISTGAAEIALFLLALIAGQPLPLTAVQLLWLNLVTNGIQDVALAFEGPEKDLMKRQPRHPNEGIFNREMIAQTIISGIGMGLMAFAMWWYALEVMGIQEYHARTLLFALMVFIENVHVFNCRSEHLSVFRTPLSRNWFIVGGVILAQGIHFLASSIPFMQNVLGTDRITPQEWFTLLLYSLIILLIMEVYKLITNRKKPVYL